MNEFANQRNILCAHILLAALAQIVVYYVRIPKEPIQMPHFAVFLITF